MGVLEVCEMLSKNVPFVDLRLSVCPLHCMGREWRRG